MGQFQRFMEVIRKLGQRVEKEHDQFLRDSQRLEDRSTVATDGRLGSNGNTVSVDFESLVGRANGVTVKVDTVMDINTSWNDDVWGSIFNSSTVGLVLIDLDMGVVDVIVTAFHNPTFGITSHTISAYVTCTGTTNFSYYLISTDIPSAIQQIKCYTSVYGHYESSKVAKTGLDSVRYIWLRTVTFHFSSEPIPTATRNAAKIQRDT